MNFFLIAAVILSLNPVRATNRVAAREVFSKCKARAVEIDSLLDRMDVQFIQKMEIESRSGDKDRLVFRITLRHGKFERKLLSATVPNGSRFNAGYDAFDKMFMLSEYFSDKGKVLSSCRFEDPPGEDKYRIRFTFAEPSDSDDVLNTVTATVKKSDFVPTSIEEEIRGLPLGMEFHDMIDVSYDGAVRMYFPSKIVMQIYGKFFFLHGEIGKVIIHNEELQVL